MKSEMKKIKREDVTIDEIGREKEAIRRVKIERRSEVKPGKRVDAVEREERLGETSWNRSV